MKNSLLATIFQALSKKNISLTTPFPNKPWRNYWRRFVEQGAKLIELPNLIEITGEVSSPILTYTVSSFARMRYCYIIFCRVTLQYELRAQFGCSLTMGTL